MNLAWTGDELSSGQAKVDTQTDTHTHTDAGNDNTRRPKGPRVKNCSALGHEILIHAAHLAMFLWHRHGGINHIPNDSTRNDQCPGHDMDRTLVIMMIKLQKTNTRSCCGALQGVSSHSPLWRGQGSKSASLTCQFSYRDHKNAFSIISQHSYGLVIELLSPRRQRPI